MSDITKPDLPLRVACAITGADPELVAECDGVLERRRVIRHAAAFALTFSVAACLWSAVLSLMLPPWAAVIGGFFAGAIIYLLDLSISSADWDLKGILAEPMTASLRSFKLTLARWVKIIIRFALALVLSAVTGTYVTLWWFNETLETYIHQQRQAYNAPIEAEYRAAKERLRRELYGSHSAERQAAVDEHAELRQQVQKSQSVLAEAEQVATNSRIEMHREETGLGGRAAGRGPKYREAELRAEAANRRVNQAQQNVDHDRARLKEIEDRITALDAHARESERLFQSRVAVLTAERDRKLRPEKSDFLMRFQALNEVKQNAFEVTLVSYATSAVIVIFEMIFFLVFLNDHASVYMVRLIARTRLEAKRVDVGFAQAWRQIDEGDTNAHVQPNFGQPETMVDRCDVEEKSLFDSPENSSATQAVYEDASVPKDEVAPETETPTERHPVIGGEPGELVTTAEALADRDRYWVNPDRPDEIWNRGHRDQLLDPRYDDAA